MDLFDNFRIALRALSANKLRSALTMLGIIIGVASVVALMAIGTGATASITGQVQGTGSNLVSVSPGQLRAGPGAASANTALLYLSDAQALQAGLPDAKYVLPLFQGSTTTTYQQNSVRVTPTASLPTCPAVRNLSLAHGRLLTDADGRDVSRVAVLGSQTAIDLFGPRDPLGQTIKINGTPFKVVGVLTASGSSGFGNADQTILVPLETGFEKVFGAAPNTTGPRQVTTILISAKTPQPASTTITLTDRIL